MTKTDITNSINTIDNGGNNTAAEVRAVLEDLRDNDYGTVVIESYTNLADNTPNTTPNGTTHYYNLKFNKQGRNVTVIGTLTNKTGSIVSNTKWLDIDAGDYTHDSNTCFFIGTSTTDSAAIRCNLIGTALTVVGSIGNNETIEVNFTYTTQD